MFPYIPVIEELLAGLIIGFCIGLTGIGGGVLVIPTLTLLFGLPPTVVVGTANLYSCLCKLYATYHHWRQKTIDFRTSRYLLIGAVPANLVVAFLVTWYARTVEADQQSWQNLQSGLKNLLAFVVIAASVFITYSIIRKRRTKETGRGILEKLKKNSYRVTAAVMMGVVVGGLIGSTSVGGGVLIIPMLFIVFGLDSVHTVGTSIFIAVILTLLSSLIYAGNSQLDLWIAIVMAIGSLAGVPLGARLSKRLPDLLLQIIISGVVLTAGVLMLLGRGH